MTVTSSAIDAVSNVTQQKEVITVTFTFRDSYEAAVAFDDMADSLCKHGNVSLKIEGHFKRSKPQTVTRHRKPAPLWERRPGLVSGLLFAALAFLYLLMEH